MQFLRTLFWVALAVGLVLFASANWHAATLKLWGGLEADVKLPVLILAAFVLGFLPTFLLYRARMWTMKRRLEGVERQLEASRPPAAAPASAAQPNQAPDPILADARAPHPS
ncbi:MAG TPA: hypothetical protein VF582_08025 [Allosphingosinicella sp.]|jgi:uncharacterized integral membrane protein